VYEAAVSGSALIVAGLAASDGAVVLQEITAGGEVTTLPAVPVAPRPSRLSIVATSNGLALLTTDSAGARATLATATRPGRALAATSWKTVQLSPDVLVPEVDTSTLSRGVIATRPDGQVLEVSSYGTTLVDLPAGTARRIRTTAEKDYCGASAASVWTGTQVISWGGESCRAQGAGVTAAGRILTFS
jgi:hypothetical protein